MKTAFAALVAAVLCFTWGFVSHEVLGWHYPNLHKFSNEDALLAALTDGATESGIYLLPGLEAGLEGEAHVADRDAVSEKWQQGPFVFASVNLGGARSAGTSLGIQFLCVLLATGLVTLVLRNAGSSSFLGRFVAVESMALFAVLMGIVPNWTWWHFSQDYTMTFALDQIISWGIAGIVLAALVKPKAAAPVAPA